MVSSSEHAHICSIPYGLPLSVGVFVLLVMGNDSLMTSIVSFGASNNHEHVPRLSPDVLDLMMNEHAAELE